MYDCNATSDSDNPVVTVGERLKVMVSVIPGIERELDNGV